MGQTNVINGKKKCNRCKQQKEVSLFSKRWLKSGFLSYNNYCKQCTSEEGKRKVLEKVEEIHDLEGEIWVEVPGFEDYLVSNKNRFKSKKKCNRPYEKILEPTLGNQGYCSLSLYYGHKKGFKRCVTHRIIAKMFIPNPENKPCVNHINHIRNDNRIENLEWCTHKENMEHAKKWKRMQHGTDRHNNTLTEDQIMAIFNSDIAQRPLAKMYNVHQDTVAKIKTGQNWSHLTGKDYVRRYERFESRKPKV